MNTNKKLKTALIYINIKYLNHLKSKNKKCIKNVSKYKTCWREWVEIKFNWAIKI